MVVNKNHHAVFSHNKSGRGDVLYELVIKWYEHIIVFVDKSHSVAFDNHILVVACIHTVAVVGIFDFLGSFEGIAHFLTVTVEAH